MAKNFRTRRRKIRRSSTKKHRIYSRNRRGAGANLNTGITPRVLEGLREYIDQKERENRYTSDQIDWLRGNIDRLVWNPTGSHGESPYEQGKLRIDDYLEYGDSAKW
jgi:hypothetical protein